MKKDGGTHSLLLRVPYQNQLKLVLSACLP